MILERKAEGSARVCGRLCNFFSLVHHLFPPFSIFFVTFLTFVPSASDFHFGRASSGGNVLKFSCLVTRATFLAMALPDITMDV